MEKSKSTAVIIPNYNGLRFMEVCMEALGRQSFRDFCVIIVDNGSTDGSREYIEELCQTSEKDIPDIEAILLSENTGFSGAVNAGISKAMAEGAKYAVLLNNDTEAEPSYLEELVRAIERDERIFSVSPLMIQYHNRELIDDAGDGYNLLGWAFQMGVGHSVSERAYKKPREVFSACAGAAIYRIDLLEEIKLSEGEYFDMDHFAYLEDLDVAYRARIRGYRNVYCPSARVYHVGSGTSGSKYNPFKVRLAARNNIYLSYKNMPLLQLVINLPGLALGILIKMAFFCKKGFFGEYRRGLSEGLSNLERLRKQRFHLKYLPSYIYIEWLLIKDSFIYAKEFFVRKFKGKA